MKNELASIVANAFSDAVAEAILKGLISNEAAEYLQVNSAKRTRIMAEDAGLGDDLDELAEAELDALSNGSSREAILPREVDQRFDQIVKRHAAKEAA